MEITQYMYIVHAYYNCSMHAVCILPSPVFNPALRSAFYIDQFQFDCQQSGSEI